MGDVTTHHFAEQIKRAVQYVEVSFLETEMKLLEEKSFEDMVFTTHGFCENGDFFYFTDNANTVTTRSKLASYFVLRDQLDAFIISLLEQLHKVKPADNVLFQQWVDEELSRFREKLLLITH